MGVTLGRKMVVFALGALISACTYNVSLFPVLEPLQEKVVAGKGLDKVALIDISGFISEAPSAGLVEVPGMVARVKETLKLAEEDERVKAIVLRINSPGGTITASDLIYHEVMAFKERTGKKVVVSILDVGASGAYYISMAADRIIAHPTAITGSIGVIWVQMNLEGLLEKVGVNAESIKSGRNKDFSSQFKPLSDEGRAIIQGIINDMYARFLAVIAKGRKNLSPEQIKSLADGRVYTASEAEKFGLVDDIGYMDDAIEAAKTAAGLKEAQVILYNRPGAFKSNIYSQTVPQQKHLLSLSGLPSGHALQGKSPQFLYLWMP